MQGAMSVAGTSAIPYYYWCKRVEVEDRALGGEGEERKEYQQPYCYELFNRLRVKWQRTMRV
jgi:hypothetical protein